MRTLSTPPRNNRWLEYHEEMTESHRYFVLGDRIKPFYTNETIDEIKTLLDVNSDYIDVINCEWGRDMWDEQPYKCRLNKSGDMHEWFACPTTEKPNHYSYQPAGLFINGKWAEMHYQDSVGEHTTSFFLDNSGLCLINHAGQLLERSDRGLWRQTTGIGSIKLDDPPLDRLVPQARRINAQKWNGFYRPIIDFLISEGLDEAQL